VRARVLAAYTPLHRELFQGEVVLLKAKRPVPLRADVYTVPLLSAELCLRVTEELDRLKAAGLGLSPPTPPHSDGVFLQEAGLDSLVTALTARLEPLARRLFPSLVGAAGLDSCRAFTVTYNAEQPGGDLERATHFDNSEVSANLSLTAEHSGGELYLLGEEGDLSLQHRQGWAVLHPGSALHGALALTGGARTNLLLFMRSSSVRGRRCPVCREQPQLEAAGEGQGDGFRLEAA
jgi:hypothetical protein